MVHAAYLLPLFIFIQYQAKVFIQCKLQFNQDLRVHNWKRLSFVSGFNRFNCIFSYPLTISRSPQTADRKYPRSGGSCGFGDTEPGCPLSPLALSRGGGIYVYFNIRTGTLFLYKCFRRAQYVIRNGACVHYWLLKVLGRKKNRISKTRQQILHF